MARYAITILAIGAIILATTGGAGAAAPEEPQELTVLAYNTHFFEDCSADCLCRCAKYWYDYTPFHLAGWNCNWGDYVFEDYTRREEIASRIEASGADIVVLQEVWAPSWQEWFVERLEPNYPSAEIQKGMCIVDIEDMCFPISGCAGGTGIPTLGSGLVLLSKFPLDNIEFERFPTFEQCSIGGCDAWADKGVLTADVDVDGVTIRIGVSHAMGGLPDRSQWDRDFIASTITPFQLKGDDYISAFDSDNTAHIVRMEDYGRWWDEKGKKYNSGGGWKHIYGKYWGPDCGVGISFELDGHPYLFRLSNANRAYIYRINDDPYTGWTSMYDNEWYSTGVVSIESFELDGHPYLFALDVNDQAYITRINDDPCTGWTTIYDGPVSSDYVAVASFELDAHPYLFALDVNEQAHIMRINDDPCTGWTGIYEGPMSSEHLNFTSFELDGHPYLFGTHTNNNAYIYRINDDPCTGWTYVYGDPNGEHLMAWYRFENNTDDSSGNGRNGTAIGGPTYSTDSRGETYSLWLDGLDDYVEVGDVGISGDDPRTIAGWVRATKTPNNWTNVFGFTAPEGTGDNTHFDIEYSGASYTYHYYIHVYGWQAKIAELDMEWHHLAATYDGKTITWYSDGHRVSSAARVLNTYGNVQIGKREDNESCFPGLVDDVRIYSRALSQGEIAQLARSSTAVFEINGHPYLFLQGNCCDQYDDVTGCRMRPGEAYMKRINDDPNTGWEDLLQLDDIRIIRDRTVVDEDGPPAIMMGDFNIHRDIYGIMNELFGKAGAVDAYIEVHGSDIGGETGDLGNNELAQHFCPGDEEYCDPINHPPDRVDYVYVRQSGAGLRLVPTEAEVFRDWKYFTGAGDYWDLSDHYPLFVKFEIFEGGCTAREKGDLNCDRLINFADLAILGSAWMSGPNDISWDGACDMSEPADDFIDTKDVDIIAQAWLTAPPVHNVTQDKWYEFIQTAITYAQDGDEIEVAPGTYYEAINFKKRAIRLYSSGEPEVTTIDANGAYHVVKCVNGEGPSTVLEGFTITGGNANGGWPDNYGGGMYNQGSSPTVTNCIFTGNSATFGGGMYNNNNSNPTVNKCIFTGNSASSGGGMYNYQNSSPTVTNSTFSGNAAATGGGGGMYNLTNSCPAVTGCNFTGNTAGSDGGGMDNRVGSDPNVTNCTFSNNSAAGEGGGMENYDSNSTLTNCTFTSNTAQYGGGMYNYNSSPPMADCNFTGNTADTDGGGIYNDNSSPTVTDCNFTGNTADTDGGGMYNNWCSSKVIGCNFTGNTADNGGGIYNGSVSTTVLTNCIFSGNEATIDGGGIYVFGGEPRLTDCIFSGNSASKGGGIYRWNPAYLTNCTFQDNTASYGGGMYNYQNYACSLTKCIFSGNEATSDGGGMYNDQSSPTVTDCTFGNNKAANGSGGMRNWISSPTVTSCKFTGNLAQHAGGMFNDNGSSPTVTNCTFGNNKATGIGGGMFNLTNSNPMVTNCTFSGNSAGSGGSGMDNRVSSNPNVTNCIIWGNEPNEIYNYSASPIVTYSDIQGGWTGEGNINDDPCFVDADNPDPNLWNLRLKPDSPCVDTGNTTALPPDTADLDDDGDTTEPIPFDLDGNNRVWNDDVDMGAYEYLIPPPPKSSAGNFEYLAIICANWLEGTEPEL